MMETTSTSLTGELLCLIIAQSAKVHWEKSVFYEPVFNVDIPAFLLVFSERIHGNGSKLCQFRFDIRNNFFAWVVKHWTRLPRGWCPKPVIGSILLIKFFYFWAALSGQVGEQNYCFRSLLTELLNQMIIEVCPDSVLERQ